MKRTEALFYALLVAVLIIGYFWRDNNRPVPAPSATAITSEPTAPDTAKAIIVTSFASTVRPTIFEAFVDELTTGKETENDRQTATDARIEAANALYEELTKLCAAGNTAWRFKDETKAGEYVVDHAETASGTPPLKPS